SSRWAKRRTSGPEAFDLMRSAAKSPKASRIADLIGDTPLLPIGRLADHLSRGVRLYAKVEGRNPSGSVKDRAALGMLRAAERSVSRPIQQRGELAGPLRIDGSGDLGADCRDDYALRVVSRDDRDLRRRRAISEEDESERASRRGAAGQSAARPRGREAPRDVRRAGDLGSEARGW